MGLHILFTAQKFQKKKKLFFISKYVNMFEIPNSNIFNRAYVYYQSLYVPLYVMLDFQVKQSYISCAQCLFLTVSSVESV